jgi:hypothetical protein
MQAQSLGKSSHFLAKKQSVVSRNGSYNCATALLHVHTSSKTYLADTVDADVPAQCFPSIRRARSQPAVHSTFNCTRCSATSTGGIPSTSITSGLFGTVVHGKPDSVERDVATSDELHVPEALLQDAN